MQLSELKSLLSRFHIRPDKRLGQNFLLSEEVLDKIVAAAELKLDDTVLEIGPGLGVLTRKLGEKAGLVLAVEKDRKLGAALRKLLKNKKNIKIISDDALFLDLTAYNLTVNSYKIVANIPYYITGKLLQNFLTTEIKPSLMVLLLQKEVAERIVAKPGDMSLLAVSVQFYADAEIVARVSKENFYPVPDVDSAIVRLRILEKPRLDLDQHSFFHLVKIGFSNKRKQLQNNLLNLPTSFSQFREASLNEFQGSKSNKSKFLETHRNYKELLQSLNINPLARAQDLSLRDWEKLYHKLAL